MTHETSRPDGGDTMTAAAHGSDDPSRQMAGMLEEFVERVPGVTHALLISRDGLRMVDSGIHKDWADKWAATLGALASLAENVPGPRGGAAAMKQAVVERDDGMLFVSIAGPDGPYGPYGRYGHREDGRGPGRDERRHRRPHRHPTRRDRASRPRRDALAPDLRSRDTAPRPGLRP
ncbi:Predicted regulator of Ras-like GTPase activity, Roadblock/LC7/MglB family [Streptomyces sp. 3213]|uniref:roadblock/LC7 domain-containing protein n=1 Tax=Streptomyces sp. 3213.3 TaxID=1855348 RepID=UPI00089C36AF|nr:roadblock/LC7 domain-containing protein [Streptomyces sp. 3213.3]SEF03981.1 Predicted regulator of Ras-like GTPase activity, Roadblock/LC7/MglB family [Streptomyces sp. 3213] [Streptomyces sp. 3213.3]